MSEASPTPEAAPSRQAVIDAYRRLSEAGIKSPDDLDRSDPNVIEANTLWDRWIAQGDASAQNEEDEHRHNLDKTMLYVDAGFTDPRYLADVLDWLMQDAHNAEKIPSNDERTKTRNLIAAAIKRVKGLLEDPD